MRRSWLDLALIVAVAAAANFVYFVCSNGDFFYPDSLTYLGPAKMLLSGHGFVERPGVAEVMRTPVYPLLLALFRTRVEPVVVLQHLMNVALAVAIYLFALRRGRFVAIAAALLFAIDPPTLHYANKVLTETVFTFLLFIAFAVAGRAPAWNGLLTGVLVLTRPVAIAYFVIAACFYRKRAAIIFVTAALVLPLAWATRNKIAGGNFTVSVIGANNLLLHRAAGAMAIADEGEFDKDLLIEQRDLQEEADDIIQRELHVADAQELPEGVRAPYYSAVARRVILQHPNAFALLTLRGLFVNSFYSDWDSMWIVSRLDGQLIQIAVDTFVAIVFFLAIIGVIALWRQDRATAMLIAGTVGYFLLISAGAEAEARFRVPVAPQIAIAAACGLRRVIAAATR